MSWDTNVLKTKITSFRIKSDQSSIFLSAFYVLIFFADTIPYCLSWPRMLPTIAGIVSNEP
jgi:hypothetical protein